MGIQIQTMPLLEQPLRAGLGRVGQLNGVLSCHLCVGVDFVEWLWALRWMQEAA